MSQTPLSNRQRKVQARARGANAAAAAAAPSARPTPAAREAKARDHDGLKLLAARGKLTRRLLAAAHAYRYAFIVGQAEGVALRSCLELDLTSRSFRPRPGQPRIIVELEARQALAAYRERACAGLPELVAALDLICGQGRTLWEAAGGKQLAAVALEAQLMTALKLLAAFIEREEAEAA